jgi:hypothetical protein
MGVGPKIVMTATNSNLRTLTGHEMHNVERWARATELAKMISFFETLPRHIQFPRPVLIGSNNAEEILIEGYATTTSVISLILNLDEPFNPYLKLQRTHFGERRQGSGKPALVPVYEEVRKGFDKVCLLQALGNCSQQIVRAHSIQKSLFKALTKNGHMYHFDPLCGPRDSAKRVLPEAVGINEATAFTGFCDRHDAEVFAPIETVPFQNTPEQHFLYHFRAFAQSYYSRAHKFKVIEKGFEKIDPAFDSMDTKSIATGISLNAKDRAEMTLTKSRFEKCFRSNNWSTVEAHVFSGTQLPDIFTTEFFAPRKDLLGRIIQDTKSVNTLKWISVTITAHDNRALVLICGETGCTVLRRFVSSLQNVSNKLWSMLFLSYAFCLFENLIVLPKWWDSLPGKAKESIINASSSRYYPRNLKKLCDWGLMPFTTNK